MSLWRHQGLIKMLLSSQGTAAGFPSRHCCHISVITLIKINHQVVQSKDTWDGYFGNDWWGRQTAVVVLSLGILKILLFPVVWCSQHYLFYYLFYVYVVIIICYHFEIIFFPWFFLTFDFLNLVCWWLNACVSRGVVMLWCTLLPAHNTLCDKRPEWCLLNQRRHVTNLHDYVFVYTAYCLVLFEMLDY